MAETLLPGLMPEEWQAQVAGCWAAKPQDRPTIHQLQHQISSLQQSLRGSPAASGHKYQAALPASCTGMPARVQAASSATAAAVSASQPWVLLKLLQGLDQWMPMPSVVYAAIGPDKPAVDGQSEHTVAASEGGTDGGIAVVHGGRLPSRRGDSASDSFWWWSTGLQRGPGAISCTFSKGIAEVSAKTASVMQQLADTKPSAQHGST